MGSAAYRAVASFHGEMLAARREGIVFSRDQGKSWTGMHLPARIKDIRKVAFSPDGQLWVGAADGIYFSRDKGINWFWLEKVPVWDVGDLSYDAEAGRMRD
jgi:ligand-binding sensor domain-containing protein